MGFATVPIDRGFALQSAHYLARRGMHRPQIVAALVDQLELATDDAIAIVDEALTGFDEYLRLSLESR